MSELDDLQRRVDEQDRELEAMRRRGVVEREARRLGFRRPDRAHRLIELQEVDGAASVRRALRALAKEEPYLVGGKRADREKRETADAKRELGGVHRQAAAYAAGDRGITSESKGATR